MVEGGQLESLAASKVKEHFLWASGVIMPSAKRISLQQWSRQALIKIRQGVRFGFYKRLSD